jgi:hypothetical protein
VVLVKINNARENNAMKIFGTKYEKMKAAMRAVIEFAGGPASVKAAYAKLSPARMLWDTWHSASRNLLYDDNHPAFKSGQWSRVHPHDLHFDLWSDDVNDRHIETALKHLGKELGLVA